MMTLITLTRAMIDAAGEIDWDKKPVRTTRVTPMDVRGRRCCPVHWTELREGRGKRLYCPTRCTDEWANAKGWCKLTFLSEESHATDE